MPRFPENPWCCRRFRRIHPLATTKPAKWSPRGPQSHPRSHLPEDNDASKTAKLLRTPLTVPSVLTALKAAPLTRHRHRGSSLRFWMGTSWRQQLLVDWAAARVTASS